MSTMNRLGNIRNPYQGDYKKVLCVCSAGLLRSPTAAMVLSQEPYNFNTRAAGIETEFALIPVDDVLIAWADEIIVMSTSNERRLKEMFKLQTKHKRIINLNIPDSFEYRDPELISLIKKTYNDVQIMERAQRKIENELDEQQ